MRMIVLLLVLFSLIVSTACQVDTPDVPPTEIISGPVNTPDRINPTMTKMPERVPPTEETTPITGEVPTELLDSIMKDLAERTGVALESITIIQDQAILWNDGSLGCPQPGVLYTQALVNGYWVVLEVEGNKYDYRVGSSGYFFLCERGIPPGAPATPSS